MRRKSLSRDAPNGGAPLQQQPPALLHLQQVSASHPTTSNATAATSQQLFSGASLEQQQPSQPAFPSSQFPSSASSSLFSSHHNVPGSVSVCSIRDAEQGIYEYLAEKHAPPTTLSVAYNIRPTVGTPIPAFSVPLRISGWLWRKEGLFRKFKRRFCVFEAESAMLQIFTSDDVATGHAKLLARFVLTQVALADRSNREFKVQGYVQERELHKRQSDSMARRKSSLPRALPGDRQRFYLPEDETLRAVTDKSLSVWAHCFRNHMKSAARLKRLRRAMGQPVTGTGNGYESEEVSEDGSEDTDDEINPDFLFEEPGRRRRTSGAGHQGSSHYQRDNNDPNSDEDEGDRDSDADTGYDVGDQILFDQESGADIRITASYQALPSTTFFEGHEQSESADLYTASDAHITDNLDSERLNQPANPKSCVSSMTSPAFASGTSSSASSSAPGSIWEDEELLSYRVDFDAIHKQQQLSVGAFGEVWLAKYRSSRSVVVKHLKGDGASHSRGDIQRFLQEIKTVCRLKHERIVAFLGVAWTMERDVQLMMEFVPGGDLRTHLDHVKRSDGNELQGFKGRWTWTTHQWRIAIDIIEALVYLHSLSPALLHCDVKSHNVLLGEDLRAKLTDFGISRYVESDPRDDQASLASGVSDGLGTGRWMAPEILSSKAGYSTASDVYAFGVVLSEIDTCEMPFHDRLVDNVDGCVAMSEDILVHQIMRQGWQPAFSAQCPELVREVGLRCLDVDPRKRPTSLEVAHRLRKAASQREKADDLVSQTTGVRAA